MFLCFSLGDGYANLFMAKDPHCDSPQTLEKRKYRGKLIHKGVQEMCKLFVSKIFVCESLDTLHALLPPLRCLFKLCTEFLVHFKSDKMQIAKKIELQSIYNPTYKNAWQMDCFHHLIEIGMFSKYMRICIDEMEENNDVIAVNRVGLVASRFLQDFCVKHAAFHAEAPPYKRPTRKRSVWHY